jgi:LCP family protein required for cell wall assembly
MAVPASPHSDHDEVGMGTDETEQTPQPSDGPVLGGLSSDGVPSDGVPSDGVPSDGKADVSSAAKPRKRGRFRRSPRWAKVLMVLGIVIVVLAGGTAGGAWLLVNRYEGKVAHEDLLGDAAAPAGEAPKLTAPVPINLLLLGSDSRDGETNKGHVAGQRSDTIMLLHINAAHDSASIISIPRDSYVDIPAGGTWKGGKNKLNAAFAFGGAPLAAKAVIELTGLTLDGALVVNFSGIREMVDAVGGVQVCVDYDVKSSFSTKLWKKGCHDMGGAEAEEFMRERKNVPGGDIGRVHQQQLVVQGVIQKVSAGGLLTNPLTLDKLLVTAAGSLTVDKNLDLRELALSVKGVQPGNVKYATAPYSSLDLKTSAGSAVQLNDAKVATMFAAVKADTLDQWLVANPPETRGTP